MNYEEIKKIANPHIREDENLPSNSLLLLTQLHIPYKTKSQYDDDFKGRINPLYSTPAFLSIDRDGNKTIYFDSDTRYWNFYIFHEIGHILLGHESNSPQNEIDADLLACVLAAPEKHLPSGIKSARDLSAYANIPIDKAEMYWGYIKKSNPIAKFFRNKPKFFRNEKDNGNKNYRKIKIISVLIFLCIIISSAAILYHSAQNNDNPDENGSVTTKKSETTTDFGETRKSETKNDTETAKKSEMTDYEKSGNNKSESANLYTNLQNGEQKVLPGDDDEDIYVAVTKSGRKYHDPECRYVKGKSDAIEISVSDAEASGYEPCKVCLPLKTE